MRDVLRPTTAKGKKLKSYRGGSHIREGYAFRLKTAGVPTEKYGLFCSLSGKALLLSNEVAEKSAVEQKNKTAELI